MSDQTWGKAARKHWDELEMEDEKRREGLRGGHRIYPDRAVDSTCIARGHSPSFSQI